VKIRSPDPIVRAFFAEVHKPIGAILISLIGCSSMRAIIKIYVASRKLAFEQYGLGGRLIGEAL
jgi:hypothetical protein